MALAETLIDGARRKLGLVQWADERAAATETAQNVIDEARRKLRVTQSTDVGSDSTDDATHFIESALRLVGAIDPEEGATASEKTDGVTALERMIQAWIAEGIYFPNYVSLTSATDTVVVPVTAEAAVTYNLAVYLAAEYGMTPPQEVVQIAVNTQNRLPRDPNDHLDTLNRMLEEWESSGLKTGFSRISTLATVMPVKAGAIPAIVNNLAILIAPEHNVEIPETVLALAAGEKQRIRRDEDDDVEALNYMLLSWQSDSINLGFSKIHAAGQSVQLPETAEEAVVYNLAVRLAPEYQIPIPPEVAAIARENKQRLERQSLEPLEASVSQLPGSRRRFNIDVVD